MTDRWTDMEKTISLCLWRGIIPNYLWRKQNNAITQIDLFEFMVLCLLTCKPKRMGYYDCTYLVSSAIAIICISTKACCEVFLNLLFLLLAFISYNSL